MESDEEEEDSELEDFIDDGPDETEDYSKHIQEIFGYNRNRYIDLILYMNTLLDYCKRECQNNNLCIV